jgi:hypothetical protein
MRSSNLKHRLDLFGTRLKGLSDTAVVQVKRYLAWEHSWKTSTAGLVLIFVVVLLLQMMSRGSAATAIIVPNSDVTTTGWAVGASADTSCTGGTLCDTVDEGLTDNTADYIQTNTTSGGETEEFALDNSVTNIASATQLVVRIYAKAAVVGGGTVDTISVNLRMSGTLQTAGTCTPGNGSWVACTVTFNGSWAQAALDSAQVQLVRNRLGSGSPSSQADTTQVSNVYATVTYTSNILFNQSAYRWFNNPTTGGFAKVYGGTVADYGNSTVQTSDGGYAVTGYTASYGAGSNDVFISKYDTSGTLSWSKTWGGTGDDEGNSIVQTSDGGYAVAGYTTSFGAGGSDAFLNKYDSSGTLSWSKTWGATGSDNATSVVQTADGGYAVTGEESIGVIIILKYDSAGNLSWSKYTDFTTKVQGINYRTYGSSIVQTSDGGYALTGYINSDDIGSDDVFIAKYDSSGNLSWRNTWGGTSDDEGNSIVQTSDGGYAITGYTVSYGAGTRDMFLAKFSSSGTLSWSKTWGGTSTDTGKSVAQTSDGGYAVAGYTTSFGAGSYDMFLAKFSSSGTLSWSKTWGGTGDDEGNSIFQTSDGGYAVAGYTTSFGAGSYDVLLARLDNTGAIAGCGTPACQSPTATTGTPSTSATNPAMTVFNASDTNGSPAASTSSPSMTTTNTVITVDVGSALAAQDTAATAPSEGTIFRLRLDLHLTGAQVGAGVGSFKLRYALKGAGTCSSPSGTYADVTDTSQGIQYAHNGGATNAMSLLTNANDPLYNGETSNVNETYQEKGTTTFTNPAIISVGQDGMWDFGLVAYQSIGGDHYCFKVVNSSGTDLNTYTVLPELVIPTATFGQAPYRWYNPAPNGSSSTFAKSNGSSGYGSDAQSVVITSDGGYATAGSGAYTDFYNSTDGRIIKYDNTGSSQWYHDWGSPTQLIDTGKAIIQTSDGGYAVTGATNSFGTGGDMYLAKYDSSGTLSWSRIWGGAGSESGNGLVQTSDGGYVITGSTSSYGAGASDMFLAKYDSSGTLSWSKTWGGTGTDSGNGIILTSDAGFAVTGQTTSFGAGSTDMFLAKYDSSGTLSWSKTWGGTSGDSGSNVVQTSDGGYAITGATSSFGDLSQNMFLAKYDSSGTLSWSRIWGGPSSDNGSDLVQTSDSGLVVVGTTNSYGVGFSDMFTAKFDSSGSLSWSHTFGQSTGDDYGAAIQLASDGGFAVAGSIAGGASTSSGSAVLIRYDSSGGLAGCEQAGVCASPTASNSSVSASTASPTATTGSPAASSSSVSASSEGTPSPSDSTLVAPATPIGAPFAPQNTPLDFPNLTPLTLRIAVAVDNSGIRMSGQAFTLEYAIVNGGAACSSVPRANYTGATTASGALRYYDDSRYTDAQPIASGATDPTDGTRVMAPQTYEEQNNFSNSASAIYAGQDGMWQFSLVIDSTTLRGRDFCLRVATSGGTQLTASNIAEVSYGPQMTQLMKGGKWFNRAGIKQNLIL